MTNESAKDTLLLDTQDWDLVLDAEGNIALATTPYATAQDVSSAIRLFDRELWYQPKRGIPYFKDMLGQLPPASLIKEYMTEMALSVPSVATVNVILDNLPANRELTGQVLFSQNNGELQRVQF